MLETYDDLLTTEEACEALKIGKNALYDLLDSGKLKGFRNGRVWRIPKQAVVEFICTESKLTEKFPGHSLSRELLFYSIHFLAIF